jgi:hypothetical protein
MIKRIVTSTLVLVTLGLGAGCGKDSDNCGELAKKIAGDKDVKATRAWLDGQLKGPDDKPLSSGDASMVCKMILDDKDSLESYQEQAGKQ